MTLKLLTPSQVVHTKQHKLEKDSARTLEVQTLIAQKYRELAQAEKDFDDAMQRNRNLWAAEEQKHENKVLVLRQEVKVLEERGAQARIPLTERKKELDTKASALDVREALITEKEKDVDEKTDLLQQKLDHVSDRDIALDERADTLLLEETGIVAQKKEMEEHAQNFSAWLVQQTASVQAALKAVHTREMAITTKELSVGEREKEVDQKEQSFMTREKALQDKYATLAQAVEEFKKKQNDIK